MVEENTTAVQPFDYDCLPANMCTVIRANTAEFTRHMNRSVQEYGQACVNVMNVHAALADRYSGRWAQWCTSVGLSIRSATRMVEVGSNVMGSAKLAELVQDGQIGKSLLQAICTPSAEPEAVEQVLSGDITTHKEYQDLLAKLKTEKTRADNANAHIAEQEKTIKSLLDRSEAADARAEEAENHYKAALADVNGLTEQNSQLRKSCNEAKGDRAAARLQCQKAEYERDKAEQRAKTAEEALKKQPLVGVLDEEEMDRQIKEGSWKIAADMNAELREKLENIRRDDLTWAFDAEDQMFGGWERMKPMLKRMGDEDKITVLDKVLETLGKIQAEAFALYPAEKEETGG